MAGSLDDPVLGNSALDGLAYTSYQVAIEGSSYRGRLSPHRALLGPKKEVTDPRPILSLSTRRPSGPMTLVMAGTKSLAIGQVEQ